MAQAKRPPPGPKDRALPADPARLRAALLAWYDRHARELPWRALPGAIPDPWAVLVSEIMLQQTTVATVRGRHALFLARFPTPAALAGASEDEVLHAWQGLGYYRRARALHACARAIVQAHAGRLPPDLASLRALPGLGPYTAAAVAAITFGLPVVPVDGNVARVLARLAGVEHPLPAARRIIDALAADLAPAGDEGRPGDFAQALMDLGATVCTPRNPRCRACPWQEPCAARARGLAAKLPLRAERPVRPSRLGTAFVLRRADGAVLLRRRPTTGLLPGMIELPSTPWDVARPGHDAATDPLAFAPAPGDWRPLPGTVRHAFTHFSLSLQILVAAGAEPTPGFWCRPEEFGALALPTLTRKLLAHAGLVERVGRVRDHG